MNARKKRKVSNKQFNCGGDDSDSDDIEARRKKIRDANKEFGRRMKILQEWSEYWSDHTLREGDAYDPVEAKQIIKRTKKITCPIENCDKAFTSIGGLKYHYARCNLVLSFKCKLCQPIKHLTTRGELLRHMIQTHYNELPELSGEQKRIANEFLSAEKKTERIVRTRSGKTIKRKVLPNAEAALANTKMLMSFLELNRKIFSSTAFTSRPFKDWIPQERDWELVTHEIDRRRYYPPEHESVNIKLAASRQWSKIKTGQSLVLTKDGRGISTSSIFFTGGTNSSAAWLPKPLEHAKARETGELIAVAVNCHSMDKSVKYRETKDGNHCIQFWKFEASEPKQDLMSTISLSYMVGHSYGSIFDMTWCPLGSSWQDPSEVHSRIGLLALACGDGQIRILSVPQTESLEARGLNRISENVIEVAPIFRVKPTACLMPPGVGPSTGYKNTACTTLSWGLKDEQRFIVAGYSNGNVALFDLANGSPILYSNLGHRHIYQPLKCWSAHGAPVTGVAISNVAPERNLIATGSIDRFVKIWNPNDLSSCHSNESAPVTSIKWDYRLRGIVSATESAFTSFHNRVRYRYPSTESNHTKVLSCHRSTVWGLDASHVTSAMATSDQAGEVFVVPNLLFRYNRKKERNMASHSLYTTRPRPLSVARVGDEDQNDIETLPEAENTPESESENSGDENGAGDVDEDDGNITDFSNAERSVANKPTKFLLPLGEPAVDTYTSFKTKYGLEFIHYRQDTKKDSKLPESCLRANDIGNIYCDRHCDYPFSTINMVVWSPNVKSYPCLFSGMRLGLCRIDRVQVVEQDYKVPVENILKSI